MPNGQDTTTEEIPTQRQLARSYKVKSDEKRSQTEKIADAITAKFGTISFLFLNLLWFTVWILINTERIPGIEPFDPYPFNFLTMVVSLEAIVLSIIVLISQNREAKINTIRDEVDTRIDSIAEEKIAKILEMLAKLMRKHGIDTSKDPSVKKMQKPVDKYYLEKKYEKEVHRKKDEI